MSTQYQDEETSGNPSKADQSTGRMIFVKDSLGTPHPKRASDPPPRPKPQAITATTPSLESWIPAENKKAKRKPSKGILKQWISMMLYAFGLLVLIGGIYFVVVQVISLYA